MTIDRRDFLGHLFSTGAFVLGASLLPKDSYARVSVINNVDQATWNPNVYLGIESNGTINIIAHRSEMGTGIRTGLPMILADEMNADWTKVKIIQAIGDEKYGDQNTDGSRSIVGFYEAFREAGATARAMLISAAAQQWNVPVSECKAENNQVIHTSSGKKLGYGELAALASKQPVPKKEDLKFKSPSEYKYIGKEIPMTDLDDICNGTAVFGIDAQMPGMVYASIERSPVYGGKLKSVDDTATKKVRGVIKTITIPDFTPPVLFKPLGGVAVIAENTWAAQKGREALNIEWDSGANASFNSDTYKQSLLDTVHKPQKVARNMGDVDAEFAKGKKIVEADYYVPHLAHASMEPPVAVAEYKDGKVVIYTATQNPQAVQDTVAAVLNIDKKNVVCNVTLLGGGFGRKSKPDYVAEAALLSKDLGKPVKVTWSREDDIRFDYYHAVAAMYMKAAIDDKGKPSAWLQRCAFPSIGSTFNAAADYGQDFEVGMGWGDIPFDIPNLRVENGPAKNHVRIGWLRSVANIYHVFAIQSFADELAASANRDRVEYMLDLLGPARTLDFVAQGGGQNWNYGHPVDKYPFETGRLRNVIELAAEKSGWAKHKPGNGRALGIAAHRSFLGYAAAVVEVEIDKTGKPRIGRVDMAVDVGTVINPDRVKSQFEGAAVFGTSIALMSEITAKNGEIQQSNFHDYQVVRINEAPRETHVHIVNSNALPCGVGETGVPPVIPAIGNAIFAASGKRIRELPIKKTKLI